MPLNVRYKDEGSDEQMLAKQLGLTSAVTLIPQPKVSKQEEDFIVNSMAAEDLDEFSADLFDPSQTRNALLRPTHNFARLEQLCQQNNALGQNISAYEVNIDGTGYTVERDTEDADEVPEEDENADAIQDFFDEIWPGRSFMTERRKLRRDQEQTGNAFLEVLRSVSGNIMMARRLDPKTMRLVQLDDPVPVTKQMKRFGDVMEVTMLMRERRFAQHGSTVIFQQPADRSATAPRITGPTISGPDAGPTDLSPGPHSDAERAAREGSDRPKHRRPTDIIYFKEFGASRDLDKWTGDWKEFGTVEADKRATEIIWLTVHKDPISPYGIPRWINQTPSVLGSRKAEEMNLQFFNSGGIPPIMVMVKGGALTPEVRQNLQQYLRNTRSDKHMAAIVEVHSTSGDLAGPNNVDVKVERFGADQQKDSMFENYDDKCEKRIRSSFRIGPLFVGRTEDFNFATAFTSYVVAESQVFKPERMEFDEIINATFMKEFNQQLEGEESDLPPLVFRSLPLTTTDIANQIRGLTLAKDVADPESFINELNEKLDLSLKVPEAPAGPPTPPEGEDGDQPPPDPLANGGQPTDDSTPAPPPSPGMPAPTPVAAAEKVAKMDPLELVTMAQEWVTLLREGDVTTPASQALRDVVVKMGHYDRWLFDHYVADRIASGPQADPNGTFDLISQAGECVTHKHDEEGAA